ncbi:MAG: RNA pseudouridine synthase, partial [Campylobacteraceae bacterium]|nr:RNA pseudouridine synthase [Campylobacteraceae bacterium]
HPTTNIYVSKIEQQMDRHVVQLDKHMHVGKHPDAKSAITHYMVKKTVAKRSLLEVNIETGRQHQIRAHLAWLGNSIVGDQRYGKEGDRMGLHSNKLTIIHPKNNKKLSFGIDAPKDFYLLLK